MNISPQMIGRDLLAREPRSHRRQRIPRRINIGMVAGSVALVVLAARIALTLAEMIAEAM